jgi:hypothetical protein
MTYEPVLASVIFIKHQFMNIFNKLIRSMFKKHQFVENQCVINKRYYGVPKPDNIPNPPNKYFISFLEEEEFDLL